MKAAGKLEADSVGNIDCPLQVGGDTVRADVARVARLGNELSWRDKQVNPIPL
jgi:hypothetical protein